MQILSHSSVGLEALAQLLKTTSGGGLKTYVHNLENADFVKILHPVPLFGTKTKTQRIVLWDEWLRFYFVFMRSRMSLIQQNTEMGMFRALNSSQLSSYFGLQFERFCLKNFSTILKCMKYSWHELQCYGPYFRQPPRGKARNCIGQNEQGVQIDILAERDRNTLMLFECKWTEKPIGKEVIHEVEKKIAALQAPKTVSIEKILISAAGASKEVEQADYFHHVIGLEAFG
jgi:hypothetical protein